MPVSDRAGNVGDVQFRNIFEINQTAKAGIQENSGCNDEKSPRARRKNKLKISQTIFVFLVTNHELEGEDMGPFENVSKGKLYDEIGKQADRGTMSKPHSQSRWPPPSLHVFFFRHHCRDSSDSTPFKIKKYICGPVPQLKTFCTQKNWRAAREMQTKVYLPSLERQNMFCFPLFWVIVFWLPSYF